MIGEAAFPSLMMALFMVFFVSAVVFVFGLMEDIGYLSRVAFVFDRSMIRLGLHGKAIMPFVMSLGCNIAGVTGSRVIDSLKQRQLAIVVSLVVPCAGMWGVVSFMSTLFFGVYTPLVLLGLIALIPVHMKMTSWFFGRKIIGTEENKPGMIMELPPFHRPNWKSIFRSVFYSVKEVAKKSFLLIVSVSMTIWLLTFSNTGIENSIIYQIGKFVEPFSSIFGFDWRLFIAFLVSAMGKEASLGVIAMLFEQGGGIMSYTGAMIGGAVEYSQAGFEDAVTSGISAASALAFIVAFFFNIPCMACIASVGIESRSKMFTVKVVAYYMITALLMGGIVYRIALLFM
jgi:ferrous iron transport protein B